MLDEVVAAPERRPGQDDEQQTGLEEERDVDQPTDQKVTLAPALCSAATRAPSRRENLRRRRAARYRPPAPGRFRRWLRARRRAHRAA